MNSVSSAIRPAARASSATCRSTADESAELSCAGMSVTPASSPIRRPRASRSLELLLRAEILLLLHARRGQAQRETRARALGASPTVEQRERAGHTARELASDRQAEPESAVCTAGAAALEALEYLLALGLRHARSAVADR